MGRSVSHIDFLSWSALKFLALFLMVRYGILIASSSSKHLVTDVLVTFRMSAACVTVTLCHPCYKAVSISF